MMVWPVLADIQYHAQLAYEDRDKAVALAIRMNDKADAALDKAGEDKHVSAGVLPLPAQNFGVGIVKYRGRIK